MGLLTSVIITLSLSYFATANCNQQRPSFVIHPLSAVAVNGTNTTFTCTSNCTDVVIDFRINGTLQFMLDNNVKIHFTELGIVTVDEQTATYMRSLVVTALNQFNNTTIQCQADAFSGLIDTYSNKAVLTVQGPLSSVVDLSYSFIDSSTVTISWSAPFTLPGTDIIGYNVSATASNKTVDHFTFSSYYELMLTDITDSPCTEINITVSGYNELDGEPSSVTVPTPDSGIQVQFDDVPLDNGNTLITINLTNTCPGLVPSSLTLTLSNSSGITVNTANITVPDGDDAVPYDGFSIPDNMTYTLTVSYTVNGYTVTTVTEMQGMDPVEQPLPTLSSSTPTISSSHQLSIPSSTSNGITSTSVKTTPTSTSSVSSSTSNTPTIITDGSVVAIAVGIAVSIIFIPVIIIVSLLIVYCYCLKNTRKGYKKVKGEYAIALRESKYPENTQSQEPSPPQSMLYQDPNTTIQRNQPGSSSMVYADLDMNPKQSSRPPTQPDPQKQPGSSSVVYADLDMNPKQSSRPPTQPDPQKQLDPQKQGVSYSEVRTIK